MSRITQAIKIPLERVLQMMPKFNQRASRHWNVNGDRMVTNSRLVTDRLDRRIKQMFVEVDKTHFKPEIEYVDVSGNNVWVLHRQVCTRHILWLADRDWKKLQKWPRSRLPIYVRWRGRLIIWNGTHRMTLARLRGLKVRARVFDFDVFIEWRKTHKPGWDARRIKVKKAKARGNGK